MEWIVQGFLLIHLLLLVGVVAGLFYAHFAQGRRSKRSSDREEHTFNEVMAEKFLAVVGQPNAPWLAPDHG